MTWQNDFKNFKGKPVVGISGCLFGENVRYDGTHKKQPVLISTLSPMVSFQALCPEVTADLGVPRPPVRLVAGHSGNRAKGVADPTLDVTDRLIDAASQITTTQCFDGFVLKSRSPSCGLGTTPVTVALNQTTAGDGLFAEQLRGQWHDLLLIDENDQRPTTLALFVTALYIAFAYRTKQALPEKLSVLIPIENNLKIGNDVNGHSVSSALTTLNELLLAKDDIKTKATLEAYWFPS